VPSGVSFDGFEEESMIPIPLRRSLPCCLATGLLCVLAVFASKTRAQSSQDQQAASQRQPAAAELSAKETPARAILRTFDSQEYEFRSAAEAMPEGKWDYRPAPGMFRNEKPDFGPAEVRTFRAQVKHVACSNFAFAAELDGKTPPPRCDLDEPPALKSRAEILTYLRDSFVLLKKSLGAITAKNMYDPVDGPYAAPNTRLGLAIVAVWHVADHYGQTAIYLRENGIVPPASRPNPPKLKEKY
jgi:hypothetical protein